MDCGSIGQTAGYSFERATPSRSFGQLPKPKAPKSLENSARQRLNWRAVDWQSGNASQTDETATRLRPKSPPALPSTGPRCGERSSCSTWPRADYAGVPPDSTRTAAGPSSDFPHRQRDTFRDGACPPVPSFGKRLIPLLAGSRTRLAAMDQQPVNQSHRFPRLQCDVTIPLGLAEKIM